jgi:hypothetical protein
VADSVAQQMLQQFAANFAAELKTSHAATAGPPPAGGAGAALPAPAARPTQLNALALLWGAVVGWLRSLFSPRGA